MKIRTVYFKTANHDQSIAFWSEILGCLPTKHSNYWSEFKCDNINLGILPMDSVKSTTENSAFVPVFEVADDELDALKNRALKNGAHVVVDISEHPDGKSYVMSDPFGNEFEITKFHG